MIEEGVVLADLTVEDDQTVSLKPVKDTKEKLPDINQLEI